MTRIHDQTQATEDKHRRVTGLEPTNHQRPDTLVGEHGLVPDPKVWDGVPKAQDQDADATFTCTLVRVGP